MAVNTGPIVGGESVDVSGSDQTLAKECRGIYVGGAGDIKLDTADGTTLTFVGLAAGVIHPIRAIKVYQTGTTATDMLAVY